MLGSNIFGKHGVELRKSLARMTKVMCASEVSKKESLEAFLACQLIPLNKLPGIRPIGIREVLRRIMGKTVMMVLKKDVIQLVHFKCVQVNKQEWSQLFTAWLTCLKVIQHLQLFK